MKKFVILFHFLMCGLLCFAQIVYNPVYDRTDFEVFHPHVDKVEIKKDSTKVYCSINFQESCGYGISKTMYIEDIENNRKYQVTKCIGIPFLPEEKLFDGRTIQIVFCFPHIENLHQFNLIEDSLNEKFFNIYGIDITKCYSKSFEESEYKRFKNMSDFYKSSNNIDRFVEYKEQELLAAQYIFGIKSLSADACYIQLAYHYDEAGDYMKAIDLGIQALECDSIQFGVENKEYPVYANTLESLSGFYQNAGKETESLHCLQKCISIRRNIGDEKRYQNVLLGLLHTGYSDESILKRISIVNKELETLPSFIGITSLSLANIYKQLASSYSLINDNNNAIKYCNKALDIIENNGYNNSEYNAELLALKCHCQRMSGLKKESLASGEAAKQLYELQNIESAEYAELLEDLASIHELNYDLEKSTQLRMTAAEIYKNENDLLSLSAIYSSISDAYQYAERLDDAEKYIKKTIDVLDEYSKQCFVESADSRDSLSNLFKQREISYNKASNFRTLALIHFKQGKFTDAINAEIESGKIINNIGDEDSYADHLNFLSNYHLKNNQCKEAIACAEQSVQLTACSNTLSQAKSKSNYAMVLFHSGDTAKAIHYAEESVSILDLHNDYEAKISAKHVLSNLYWKIHNYDKAEQYLSDVLDYLKSSISNEIIGMTQEQKQRLLNKYVNYFYLYRNIIDKSDRNNVFLSKLYDYVLFSKNLLLDTEIQQDGDGSERIKITWKDIQQHLSEDDIAIEFISTVEDVGVYHTYHALIVDKKQPCPQMVTLFNEKDLEEKKKDTRNIDDIVGELIWNPIINLYPNAKNIYFSPDGVMHILPIEYYDADGVKNMSEHYNMYRLSSTKEIVKKLSKPQFNSAVLFGGLDYNSLKEFSSKDNLGEDKSKWRDIAERGGFDPLYNTLIETQEIEDIFAKHNIPTTLYTGENGTEESFRNLSGKNNSIIHLATHGMYVLSDEIEAKREVYNFDFLESLANEKDPVKEDIALTHSFLVMAGGNRLVARENVLDKSKDGILTSMEISQLDLRGLDLVVLSACETAQGDIYSDGVYGLQRGFKKAGANAIMMSLDKVDDKATQLLMVEFYNNIAKGLTLNESLKKSQHFLRKVENGKYDDPKYWGTFILLDAVE